MSRSLNGSSLRDRPPALALLPSSASCYFASEAANGSSSAATATTPAEEEEAFGPPSAPAQLQRSKSGFKARLSECGGPARCVDTMILIFPRRKVPLLLVETLVCPLLKP